MRRIALSIIVAVGMMLTGCGSGMKANITTESPALGGTWTTSLITVTGSPMLNFNFNLNQTGGLLIGSNMQFPAPNTCFGPGSIVTGQINIDNSTHSASVDLKMLYSPPDAQGQNELQLKGTVSPNKITGTWVMTGVTSGCNSLGSFSMTRN